MNIVSLCVGPIQNNVYIAYDTSNKCVVIDAPFGSAEAIKKIIQEKQLTVEFILITHTHWDHVGDLAELQRQTNAKVCVHENDIYRLLDDTSSMGIPIEMENVQPDMILHGGESIQCGEMKFRVVATPGHTEGGICFIEDTAKVVFAGDTLFRGSIGRTDFPGGDFATLISSIKSQLLLLDDDYVVYCGHNEPTTIGYERKTNPFLI